MPEDLMSTFLHILAKRGISEKIARLFEVGLLVKDRVIGFFPYEIPQKFAGKSGIIFPIKNLYKEVISFCIRYPKNAPVKYDTVPFKKFLLFGLEHSFPFIYKYGAILVEGPFDVMALMSHGILNVCSPLGTSLNFTQFCLLYRFTTKCIIVFDGDVAGKAQALKVSKKMSEFGLKNIIAQLPSGLDPDEFVIKYGPQGFKRILPSL